MRCALTLGWSRFSPSWASEVSPFLSLEFSNSPFDEFQVEFVTNRRNMAGLGKTKDITTAPDFEVMHGKVKACTQVGKIHEGL